MIIRLNEMVFYGFHGVHDEERKLGQRFIVSVEMATAEANDSTIHSLEDTVDYTMVYGVIKDIIETGQFHLLETCVNTVADRILSGFSLVMGVKVCIRKPSVAIQGILDSVEVELNRRR